MVILSAGEWPSIPKTNGCWAASNPAWCGLPGKEHAAFARLQTRASEVSATGKLNGPFVTLCRWLTLAADCLMAAWNDRSQILDKVAADPYKK
jgi:hypothetical protein